MSAKKIKIIRPRDNVVVTVTDLDRAKIDAHNWTKKKTFFATPVKFLGYSWGLAGFFGSNCVTRAPLLYFIRSCVALLSKVCE